MLKPVLNAIEEDVLKTEVSRIAGLSESLVDRDEVIWFEAELVPCREAKANGNYIYSILTLHEAQDSGCDQALLGNED